MIEKKGFVLHFFSYTIPTLFFKKKNTKNWGAQLRHGEVGSGTVCIHVKLGSDAWLVCDKADDTATFYT